MKTDSTGGPGELNDAVFKKGLCSVCGACAGHCPYFCHYQGRIIQVDQCDREEGRCFRFCPLAGSRMDFPGQTGEFRQVWATQAVSGQVRSRAQYGGTVTALVSLALTENLVREVVLTGNTEQNAPQGLRAGNRSEVLAAAGSRFAASGVLAELNRALAEDSDHPLALVGTPCQITAAAAMRRALDADPPFQPRRLKVLIGLFCTWAMDYRRLADYLNSLLLDTPVLKYDIPPPPAEMFQVVTSRGTLDFPLRDLTPLRLEACRFCPDLTAAQADLSVGALEGRPQWNTLLVRTSAGEELFEKALERKIIRTEPYPTENMEHLLSAARARKERAEAAWAEKEADHD